MYLIEMFPTKDTFITSIRTGPVSGDPISKDQVISSDPGGCMIVVRTRRVMRMKRLVTPTVTLTDVTPYCGLIKPAKEDISFVSSLSFGIQAVYKHAEAVGEPVLLEHEIPTATYVSFIHLLVPVLPPPPPRPASRRYEPVAMSEACTPRLQDTSPYPRRQREEEAEAQRQRTLAEANRVKIFNLSPSFVCTILVTGCFAVRYYMISWPFT